MGFYTFKWNHPASEVYVTGTFDGWSRSTRLEKDGDRFCKRVQLPRERTLYKFIVDGHWTTDNCNPTETEYTGITNNVLDAYLIEEPRREPVMSSANIQSSSPESTTAALAGAVPKESSRNDNANAFVNSAAPESTTAALAGEVPKSVQTPGVGAVPGGFPQTPANEIENQTFSVNPLPASETADNPISLQPGEPVPRNEIGSQSVTSNVKLDQESYEKADASNLGVGTSASPVLPEVVTPSEQRAKEGRSILDIPPVSASTIPESSLPIAGGSRQAPILSSVAPTEGSAVPEVVTESQERAGVPAEASAVPDSVEKKHEVEEELKNEVPAAPVTADGTPSYTDYAKSAAAAVTSDDGTATYSDYAKSAAAGVAATIGSVAAAAGLTSAAASTEPTSEVPEVVKDSQAQAGAPPEASGVVEAVEGKKEFESELKAEVPEVTATTDSATAAPIAEENAKKASEQSGPVVTNGITEQPATFLSGPKPVTEPLQPAESVPEPVKESQAEAGAAPEASGVPASVEKKAAMETELQQKVHEEVASASKKATVEEDMSPTTTGSAFKEDSTPINTPAPSTAPTEPTEPTTPKATEATEAPKNGKKSPSPNGKDKKAKRRSFFGRLKDNLKLGGHKKEGESS